MQIIRLFDIFSFSTIFMYKTEHCLECILSIIEFIQFKQKLYVMLLKEKEIDINIEELENHHLILPDSCPQSMIVSQNDNNFKLMARLLFLKYIQFGASWEINIAYNQRAKYYNLMENEHVWYNEMKEYDNYKKLYALFDYCIIEMISLVKSAFARFKREDDFLLLQKHELEKASSNSSVAGGIIKKLSTNIL